MQKKKKTLNKKQNKALFLDRDGIINVDHGYIYKIEDFEFTEGLFELLQLFSKQGYLIFVVTNQSGIGRGYYTLEDFKTLTAWMTEQFRQYGIKIEEVQYCPHAPEENCKCRKPNTGMVDNILKKYTLDLERSWLIGDKQSDIDLVKHAGIGSSIAIGERPIHNATFSFSTILETKRFLEENQDIIKS